MLSTSNWNKYVSIKISVDMQQLKFLKIVNAQLLIHKLVLEKEQFFI